MTVSSIIFDCDGTLLKSLILGMGAYNFALKKVGARFHESDEIKKFFGTGADRIFFKLLGDEKKAASAYEFYLQYEFRQIHKIFLHQGIRELLDNLKTTNLKLAVVTGRHYREIELLFQRNDLFTYFETIVCDNHLTYSKPHPEGILMAVKELNIPPQETLYVGDAVMDMQAAKSAGVRPVAALWDDWVRPEEMLREGPAFMAKKPGDLWNWLQLGEL